MTRKHENVTVSGQLIMDQWCSDNITASEHAGYDLAANKHYEVSWPDHILTPQYNTDCTILGEV